MSAALAVEKIDELLTLEEFAEIDFHEVVELVEGRVQYMGNNNPDHSKVLINIGAEVKSFLKENDLGEVFGGDVTVLVRRGPDTGRGIDLAFASHETLRNQPEGVSALHIAPELAVEIMSPSNVYETVMTKVSEYFAIGVREVWLVSIATRTVNIFQSSDESKIISQAKGLPVRCPDILPGFEISLETIFSGLPPRKSDLDVETSG